MSNPVDAPAIELQFTNAAGAPLRPTCGHDRA
jgi:hypothetical protein